MYKGFEQNESLVKSNLQLALPAVQRVGAHCGEEVSIVRDHDERVLPLLEVALEPDDGVQVEVVGGLVEKEQPRLTEKSARQAEMTTVFGSRYRKSSHRKSYTRNFF